MHRDARQDDLTVFLDQLRDGDGAARDRLVAAVYQELRSMAGRLMRAERVDHTLQPSALVNEALIRIFDAETLRKASDRRYLFKAASRAMRQVLVDHARARKAEKRGGGRAAVPMDDVLAYFEEHHFDVIALHEALERLAELHERQEMVVSLKFFSGLEVTEIARTLEVSEGTVRADWLAARAWLKGQLGEEGAG